MTDHEVLSDQQIGFYRENGYLVLESHIPQSKIEQIRTEIARFQSLARGMTQSDDKLDLEDSHTADEPRVRRIKLPHTQSPVFRDLMMSDTILAPVRDIIGPSLRLHTSKLNMKSAGYGAAVEWHQDWAFYPQTNDDVLAVGVIIDDMVLENGPLMVFPGSHRHPIYDHHHGGYFAGAIDMATSGLDMKDAVPLMGPAGSISIHHARIVHGSALNVSTRDRRILFYEMMAADAFPLFGNQHIPATLAEHDSKLLCGDSIIEPRLENVPVRIPLPMPPTQGSIYEVQKAMGQRSFDSFKDTNHAAE